MPGSTKGRFRKDCADPEYGYFGSTDCFVDEAATKQFTGQTRAA
jgi:hypothetical protein